MFLEWPPPEDLPVLKGGVHQTAGPKRFENAPNWRPMKKALGNSWEFWPKTPDPTGHQTCSCDIPIVTIDDPQPWLLQCPWSFGLLCSSNSPISHWYHARIIQQVSQIQPHQRFRVVCHWLHQFTTLKQGHQLNSSSGMCFESIKCAPTRLHLRMTAAWQGHAGGASRNRGQTVCWDRKSGRTMNR